MNVNLTQIENENYTWKDVRTEIQLKNQKGAVHIASEIITNKYSFITLDDSEDLYFYENGYYKLVGETKIKAIVQQATIIDDKLSSHFINEIINSVKRKTYLSRKEFKAPENLICLRNGIYNFETREMEIHSPKIYFTSKIDLNYNENATCYIIDEFIKSIVDQKYIDFLYDIPASCLVRNYDVQKAIMLTGTGQNGKSIYLRLIESLIGRENVSSEPIQKLMTSDFSKAELFGKLANICGDLPATIMDETGDFKNLTGQDTISAQRKFGQPFQYDNFAKLIFSANEVPATQDTTDGFFRRWVIIDFPYIFRDDLKEEEYTGFVKRADRYIFDKISVEDELEGFLLKCLKLAGDIYHRKDFKHKQTIESIRIRYMLKSNSAVVFSEEFLTDEVEDDTSDKEPFVEKEFLYKEYESFCKLKGIAKKTATAFYRQVKERWNPDSIKKLVSLGVRKNVYTGISYKDWRDVKEFDE